jgi:uncharacterized membrane protein YphA (DoxX/SURF4 family)
MSATKTPSKGLNISLWVVQVLLAFAFGMAGFMKSTQPFEALNKAMPWTLSVGETTTRFIGLSELLGAVGLLLPAITRILPFLTSLAGLGLVTVMVLASGFHVTRGEYGMLPVNAVLASLALFVAWGRYRAAPIAPRNATSSNQVPA